MKADNNQPIYLKLNNVLQKAAGIVSCFFFGLMFCFVILSVISREFEIEISFSEELTRYSIIIMVFTGSSYVQNIKRHVGMDMFLHKLSLSYQILLSIVVQISSVIFFAIALYSSFKMWQIAYSWNLMSETDLRFPLWITQFFVPLGLFLLFTQSFFDFVYLLTKLKKSIANKSSNNRI